jgi:hypothetical protein
MSLLDVDEVEALMATGLAPAALQGVIDRDEDRAANSPRYGIGQLVGERTQDVWRPMGGSDPILLRRPTDAFGGGGSGDSLLVVDNGVTRTDVLLFNGIRLEPLNGLWVGPKIEITYTPIDELQVKAQLFEMIQLTVTFTPFSSESNEGHSYTRPRNIEDMRAAIMAPLHPALARGASVRIHSRGDLLASGPRART